MLLTYKLDRVFWFSIHPNESLPTLKRTRDHQFAEIPMGH